jgi:hypothetical protein
MRHGRDDDILPTLRARRARDANLLHNSVDIYFRFKFRRRAITPEPSVVVSHHRGRPSASPSIYTPRKDILNMNTHADLFVDRRSAQA